MKLQSFITDIWHRTRENQPLSFSQKLIYLFLRALEPLQRIGFMVSQAMRRRTYSYKSLIPVISLGNISIGGTGKSVVARFLIDSLSHKRGAVVLRGYRGENERKGSSLLVSDGVGLLVDPAVAGDEAAMLAQLVSAPIVVGKDRGRSCALLEAWAHTQKKTIDYIILDDAYQNHQVAKQLELLLLDGRFPFENWHCLPAGRLRELDVSRADAILVTHADELTKQDKSVLVGQLKARDYTGPLFFGWHKPVFSDLLTGTPLVALAGIGSFTGFEKTLRAANIVPVASMPFPDHHLYTLEDIMAINLRCSELGAVGIITTYKDALKLDSIEQQFGCALPKRYLLDVTFAFLTKEEENSFFQMLTSAVFTGKNEPI